MTNPKNSIVASYLRSIFISPEFALIIAAATVVVLKPAWSTSISSRIETNTDYFTYALLAPIAICVWTIAEVRGIIFPEQDKKQLLQKHPKYSDVRTVCNVTVLYALLFAMLSVFSACKITPDIAGMPTFVLLIAVLGSLFVGLTSWFAKNRINEIFCTEIPPSS